MLCYEVTFLCYDVTLCYVTLSFQKEAIRYVYHQSLFITDYQQYTYHHVKYFCFEDLEKTKKL